LSGDGKDCNVRANELASVREELQRRRRTLLETARRSQEELEALRGAERDPEFEEGAQREHEQYTLSLLGENQRRQVSMIDAALARVDSGAYGICADCGTDIDRKRLHVLPFALLCADCASRRERGTVAEIEGPSL
jgi:RNA polymerase-binding transcription factor